MKACVKCGEDDLDKFEVNKIVGYKIYYRSYCRSCYNTMAREKGKTIKAQYIQDITHPLVRPVLVH